MLYFGSLLLAFAGSAQHPSVGTACEGGFMDQYTWLFVISVECPAQGLLFPLTTLKPYFPIGPGRLGSFLAQWGLRFSRFCISLFGTNPDMAYPFFAVLGWAWSWLDGMGYTTMSCYLCAFILFFALFSLLFSFLLLCFTRFSGPTYIPSFRLQLRWHRSASAVLGTAQDHPSLFCLLLAAPLISSHSFRIYFQACWMPSGFLFLPTIPWLKLA